MEWWNPFSQAPANSDSALRPLCGTVVPAIVFNSLEDGCEIETERGFVPCLHFREIFCRDDLCYAYEAQEVHSYC
jgi:hypothetical protein